MKKLTFLACFFLTFVLVRPASVDLDYNYIDTELKKDSVPNYEYIDTINILLEYKNKDQPAPLSDIALYKLAVNNLNDRFKVYLSEDTVKN